MQVRVKRSWQEDSNAEEMKLSIYVRGYLNADREQGELERLDKQLSNTMYLVSHLVDLLVENEVLTLEQVQELLSVKTYDTVTPT